jgi:hypothetical protein
MEKGKYMAKKSTRLTYVSVREVCFACQVGNHEKCEDAAICECAHLKGEPSGWREKLREEFLLRRSRRKKTS